MMASKPIKRAGGKRKATGYQMPGHIPKGEVITDTGKVSWSINVSIGMGGFGEIYSASRVGETAHNNYVVKIEPLENGPLFCERNVYVRVGKKEDIKDFMELRKLKTLGMPQFYGFGSHDLNGTKYRFLVMERYSKDLWSLFLENNREFPAKTTFTIGIQIINVLEYLHSKGYVHADIKGANLLLGQDKAQHQVFLVDFGLACKYPIVFKPDPRKAHNGTLEYTSRDAHEGVPTRRGDVEIVGYNMLQWTSSMLPWEKLKDPKAVFAAKTTHMKTTDALVLKCFKNSTPPDALLKYFKQCTMAPLDEPDYDEIRRILLDGVKEYGRADAKLNFSRTSPTRRSKLEEQVNIEESTPKIKKARLPKRRSKSVEVKNSVKAEVAVEKRSWRDFPTVVNGAQCKASSAKVTVTKSPVLSRSRTGRKK